MARHDDDLQQITRDRLRAVAARHAAASASEPPGAGAGSGGRVPGDGPWAAEPPPSGGASVTTGRRARQRDRTPPQVPPPEPTARSTPRWWPVEGSRGTEERALGLQPEPGWGSRRAVGWSPTEPRPGPGPGRAGTGDLSAVGGRRTDVPAARERAEGHADPGRPGPHDGPGPAHPQDVPAGADAQDVVARVRAEALAAASATYADAHGHPLDRVAGATPRRRWYLSLRHALVAGAAVTVLAVGVVIRAVTSIPDGPEPPAGSVVGGSVTSASPSSIGTGGASAPVDPPVGAAADPGGRSGADEVAGGREATSGAAAPGAPSVGAPSDGPPSDGAGASGDGAEGGAGAAELGAAGGSVPGGAPVVVHVVGQVGRPGVVHLAAGSRVADALAVAGGATSGADLSAVNLARVVADGEQIMVPAPGQVVPAASAGAASGGSAGAGGGPVADSSTHGRAAPEGVVDLNAASLAELDGLPGIGPVLAQRILDLRAANGPFRHVEELGEVLGIGDALLQRLAPLVRV